MGTVLRLGWLEIKLFLREPMTVVTALALPLVLLFILGGVFGDQPSAPGEEVVWRGQGPMSYYVPAYLVLAAVAVCLISIPTHLAGDRERGVLRRYRASAVGPWAIAGAELTVALAVSVASAMVLLAGATVVYDFRWPERPLLSGLAFLVIVVGYTGIGLLLSALAPTARAAQSIGLILWFVMMLVGGAGPPEEVLTGPMRAVSLATPMLHTVRMLHQPWLGLAPGWSWLAFIAMAAVSGALGLLLFRWE
ncbi:MAG: ABC transporter permease [Acidimicrobiales bacterium]